LLFKTRFKKKNLGISRFFFQVEKETLEFRGFFKKEASKFQGFFF